MAPREDATTVTAARRAVRRWLPYAGIVAGFQVAVAVLGAVLGHEGRSSTIPVRSPADSLPAFDPLALFAHDAQVAALAIVGVCFVALPTAALLGYNAFLFGAALADATAAFGLVPALSIVLPHGVFELPAFWLAGAVSLRWLHLLWRTTREGADPPLRRTAGETILVVLAVAVLLAVAAVVEATITRDLVASLT